MIQNRAGFTLVELMIVITIIAILSIGTFVPYNYYSQLSSVRVASEEVNQAVNDAKILATNGYTFPGTSTNANIGLVFKKWSNTIDELAMFSGSTALETGSGVQKIKSISLESSVQIASVDPDTLLVLFSAPNGDIQFYGAGPTELSGSTLNIWVGWKGIVNGPLSRSVTISKRY